MPYAKTSFLPMQDGHRVDVFTVLGKKNEGTVSRTVDGSQLILLILLRIQTIARQLLHSQCNEHHNRPSEKMKTEEYSPVRPMRSQFHQFSCTKLPLNPSRTVLTLTTRSSEPAPSCSTSFRSSLRGVVVLPLLSS